jgi:hypothetical protein
LAASWLNFTEPSAAYRKELSSLDAFGLILCTDKSDEHVELLKLDETGISRVTDRATAARFSGKEAA